MSRKKKKEKGEMKTASFMGFSISSSEEATTEAIEPETTRASDEKIITEESAPQTVTPISEEVFEAFEKVENMPIKECEHDFEMQPGGTYKKNSKGIPHFYKTFVCKKCGYSETRVVG